MLVWVLTILIVSNHYYSINQVIVIVLIPSHNFYLKLSIFSPSLPWKYFSFLIKLIDLCWKIYFNCPNWTVSWQDLHSVTMFLQKRKIVLCVLSVERERGEWEDTYRGIRGSSSGQPLINSVMTIIGRQWWRCFEIHLDKIHQDFLKDFIGSVAN